LKSEAAARRNAAGGATPRPADAPGEDDLATEALRRHRQALFHAPNDSDLHYRYGLLLRQVGRCEQAIGAFRSAVTINPDYSKALVKLGLALREIDQSDEAMTSLRRALELNPAHVDAHYQLALLFAQRSRFDLAVEEFDAEATSGANPSLRANLALALQAVGMVDRAGAVWRSICELPAETELDYANRERVLRGTEP
jgi:Flp pilus assembly protein TadD